MPAAIVFGCAGPRLRSDERLFFRDVDPWGFILFARNVVDRAQLSALTTELRLAVDRDAPVFIDQEGGRVARLRAPHWREWPAVGVTVAREDLSDSEIKEALARQYRVIAAELKEVGIDVNCAPVLDCPVPGAHDVIGDRALGSRPEEVAARGRAVCEALLAGGVVPVLKHIPGHGRSRADSHSELPVVEATREALSADLAPFRALADMPLAMTAHVTYSAVDPGGPATCSSKVVSEIVRGEAGFDGMLVSDDIGMGALEGPMAMRCTTALSAGCDAVLHCDGELASMMAAMAGVGALEGESARRAAAAEARRGLGTGMDALTERRAVGTERGR